MVVIDQWPLQTLQQRILAVLQRLNDLDTRSASFQTLLAFIHRVETDAVAILVESLCQNHVHQKPAARALIVELLGRLSRSMRSALTPYAPRIVQFLLRSLQDVDHQVQEAGAVALGQVCRHSLQQSQLQSVLSSLYRAMANKPTPIQASVARALARLLSDLDPGLLDVYYEAISTVITKHLCKPSIHPVLQRHLFNALSAIPPSKASPCSVPCLFRAMTSSLVSGTWQVSQAAAGALHAWADPRYYNVHGAAVTAALQQARFHRIAQVREAVIASLNRWKELAQQSKPKPSLEPESVVVSNEHHHGEPEAVYNNRAVAAQKPVRFEFAPESSPSSRPKQRNIQQKILRQQRLLFDLVEDLCRRVDDGMINVKARLTSLESATELLQQQQQHTRAYMDPQSSCSNDRIWTKVVDLLEQNNAAGALRACCESGDDINLVRLLGRLSLESQIATEIWPMLMVRFSVLLGRCLLVDNITPWILKAFRENVSIPSTIHDAIMQARLQPNVSPSLLTLSKKMGLSLESST